MVDFPDRCRSQVVQRHLKDILANLFGVLRVVGQRLRVGNHDVDFIVTIGILQLHPLFERPCIMAYMEAPGRTVPG